MAELAEAIVTPSANKAPVWRYFGYRKDVGTGKIAVGKKVTCKLCRVEVAHSGGTTNLRNHLRSHHRPEYAELFDDDLGNSERQRPMDTFCKPSRKVEKLSPSSTRAQELTGAVSDFIVRDLRPVNVVDSVGFLHLMEVADPRYTVPCRRTINSCIDRRYLAVKANVQQELKQVDYMGMTTDMWTSRSKDGYISITVHYISPQFVMKHHNLQSCPFPGSHTALNIATMLKKLVEEDWGIDLQMQVPAFTTDNAQNVVNAISENLMLVAIPCAGHSLNLAVQDALSVAGLRTGLARGKKVVEHFNHSRLDSEELKVKQKQLELPPHRLIQDVATRWNSTLDMASRLCEQQAAIAAVLHGKRNLHHLELSPQEWHNLEDLIKLLEPFKNATEVLSGQKYPTLSCLGPILADLKEKIAANPLDSTTVKSAKRAMRIDLSERYQNLDVLEFMNKAAFLDPRFKSLAHLSTSTVEDVVMSLQRDIVHLLEAESVDQSGESTTNDTNEEPPPQKKKKLHPLKRLLGEKFGGSSAAGSGSVSSEDQAQAELARYKAEPQSPLDHCPLQWWRDHQTIYPLLSKLTRKYLCLPSTSVPSESLFSTAGIIVNEKRATLDPHSVDKMVFLHDNLDPVHLNYKRMFKKCKCDVCIVKECKCTMCTSD